jgi:hypothetical protein
VKANWNILSKFGLAFLSIITLILFQSWSYGELRLGSNDNLTQVLSSCDDQNTTISSGQNNEHQGGLLFDWFLDDIEDEDDTEDSLLDFVKETQTFNRRNTIVYTINTQG